MQIETTKGDKVEVDETQISLVKFMGAYWLIEAGGKTFEIDDDTFLKLMGLRNETDSARGDIWTNDDTRRMRKLV